MNDLNHMDVVPRIIDNSMKITKEQLKNDKKKNEVYVKPIQINASTQKTEQQCMATGFFSNINYILVVLIIVLLIVIIYMIYLVYKYKKNTKKVMVKQQIQPPVNQPIYEIKQAEPEDYSQYIQSDDEAETISMKSNNSNNVSKKIKIINEEDIIETKSDINESIVSNIELESISDEEPNEFLEESDNISIIDKLQQDLKD